MQSTERGRYIFEGGKSLGASNSSEERSNRGPSILKEANQRKTSGGKKSFFRWKRGVSRGARRKEVMVLEKAILGGRREKDEISRTRRRVGE